jgi:hypothetical protein
LWASTMPMMCVAGALDSSVAARPPITGIVLTRILADRMSSRTRRR